LKNENSQGSCSGLTKKDCFEGSELEKASSGYKNHTHKTNPSQATLGESFSDDDLEGLYGDSKQVDIMRNPLEQTLSFSPLTSHD